MKLERKDFSFTSPEMWIDKVRMQRDVKVAD